MQNKLFLSEIDKKYQELLETLSPEQEEVITEYCNAIFSSGADTEKFFYRLGLKDGLNLKNTVKSVLEMISWNRNLEEIFIYEKRNKQINLVLYCISSVFHSLSYWLYEWKWKIYGYSMVMSWFLISLLGFDS